MRTPFGLPGLALIASLAGVVALGFALVLLGLPASLRGPQDSSAPTPSQSVGGSCGDPEKIRSLISKFLDEYDKGQPGLADRFFAPAPNFQCYSERPRRQSDAALDRSTLEAYLLQRHADGDRLTLVNVQVSGVRSGIGNFGFMVERDGSQLLSKGALDCRIGKFIVWSLGPDPGP